MLHGYEACLFLIFKFFTYKIIIIVCVCMMRRYECKCHIRRGRSTALCGQFSLSKYEQSKPLTC